MSLPSTWLLDLAELVGLLPRRLGPLACDLGGAARIDRASEEELQHSLVSELVDLGRTLDATPEGPAGPSR